MSSMAAAPTQNIAWRSSERTSAIPRRDRGDFYGAQIVLIEA
jgi:hypothetical protein